MNTNDRLKLTNELQRKIDFKTKPIGALGKLEELAMKIGLIQGTNSPKLIKPHVLVFAADHGIANEGVSAYPQEVTYQMVLNFLNDGAAINVFAKENGLSIKVIDAGVAHEFGTKTNLIDQKIGLGTKSFLNEPAMSTEELKKSIDAGEKIVNETFEDGCNIIGFGEMGIGNTSSASMIMSLICQIPMKKCVGRGTGVNDDQLRDKIQILEKALERKSALENPMDILREFGGFEIAQMVGGMLAAANNQMILMIDGFIATAAYLIAHKVNPKMDDYSIFCHQSGESGHQRMLGYLNARPLLDLGMRLGEGTGCTLAYPLIKSAVGFLNDMSSFENAGVSNMEA